MDFILGLGIALPVATSTGVATVTGIAEGVSHQRKMNEEASNESRQLKFHVDVSPATPLPSSSSTGAARSQSRARQVSDTMVVLRDDKLYLEPRDPATKQPADKASHPFTGFYVQYPDPDRPLTRGMVSTISRDPPVLNWIYVDRETHEVKYSNRTGSIAHHVGDYDWTKEFPPGSYITMDGWEGFLGVEEGKGVWALYYDVDDDGLEGSGRKKGRRTVEVRLERRVLGQQEVNKWGLGSSGNLGVKKTEHQVKGKDVLKEEKEEEEQG